MVENSHWAEGLGEYSAVWGADNKKWRRECAEMTSAKR